MKIVIDGFGGDNAPDEVLKGAALAVKELGIDIAITGDEKILMERMKALDISDSHLELVHAEGVITTEDAPKSVIKENSGTSMGKALYYLAEGNADAFISAGSTAAIVVGGTMVGKRIKGVKRTALVPLMPCLGGGRYAVVDGGANLECRPEMLQQFAVLGSIFMEKTMGIEKPRVGLLNIGTEPSKGMELQKAAHALLTQAHEAGRIRFVGNIEGREAISQGAADVLVTDGFTGNIFLKTVEGAASLFSHALKDMLLGSTKNKLAALLLKNSIGAFKKRFDANEVGGTALLGISQPVIKAHGSSNAYAFFNAIRQAQVVAQADIVGDIAANVAHMRLEPGEKEG